MEKIFFPASVVVFGVSAAPTNLGRNIVLNLQRFGYKGLIHAVGKDGGDINGVPIHSSIDEVPGVPAGNPGMCNPSRYLLWQDPLLGMFDANNMPILCQFVSPRHRAAGYGLMNMTGVFAGALRTEWLGRSTDAGNLGRDLALLAIPVAIAVVLLLIALKPVSADKISD